MRRRHTPVATVKVEVLIRSLYVGENSVASSTLSITGLFIARKNAVMMRSCFNHITQSRLTTGGAGATEGWNGNGFG